MNKNLKPTPKFNLKPNRIKNCIAAIVFSSILLTPTTIFADNSGQETATNTKAVQIQKPAGGDLAKLNANYYFWWGCGNWVSGFKVGDVVAGHVEVESHLLGDLRYDTEPVRIERSWWSYNSVSIWCSLQN